MSDFFNNSDISQQQTEQLVSETLKDYDDGELYLENSKRTRVFKDDDTFPVRILQEEGTSDL